MEFLLYEAPPRAPAGARRLLEAPQGPLLAGVPALVFLNDLVAHHARNFFIVRESHAVGRAALGHAAQAGGVTEHLRQRHHGLDDLGVAALGHALDLAALAVQVADHVAH